MIRQVSFLILFLTGLAPLQGQQGDFESKSTDSLIHEALDQIAAKRPDSAGNIIQYINETRPASERQAYELSVLKGRLLLENGDIPNALFSLKQTLRGSKTNDYPLFKAHLHHGLGMAYNQIESPDQADFHYNEAIALYEKAGDLLWASNVASERGVAVMFRSQYLEGVDYLTRALAYVVSMDSSKASVQPYLPQLFMNLALGNNRLDDKELAIQHAKLAIHYGHKTKHFNTPSFYATLGAIYRGMDDYETALKAYKKSLIIAKNRGQIRSMRMALSNVANLFSLKGELDSAIHYLRNASQVNEISDFHLQNFNVDLAKYYQNANKPDSAIFFAKKAADYGQSITNFRIQRDAYQLLADLYQEKNQMAKALDYQKLYKVASDSIVLQASAREYDQLRVRLQTMDKEYELAQLSSAMDTQRKLNISLIASVVLAVLALFFIVLYWLSERRRKNIEINNIIVSKKTVEADLRNSQQELADNAVRILAQHQFLEELESTVKQSARRAGTIDAGTAQKIDKVIKLNKANVNDWDSFITNFGNAHSDFFQNLKTAYPQMTSGDLKHCALLKMNTSVKQAAQLLGVDQKSVTQARYRLKKKMQLSGDESVHEAIYRF